MIEEILKNRQKLQQDPNWHLWKFQLQKRIRGENFHKYFVLTPGEKKGIRDSIRLNTGTTPYYLLLADPQDPTCPVRRMIIPDERESIVGKDESPDPLHEERLSPLRGLTHMYKDRVLLFANHECPVYCRHCMRGRKVSDSSFRMTMEDLDRCLDYVQQHSEIEDVVISGGDPFILADKKIEKILHRLAAIPHVKICRIGSRVPVTLPARITDELCRILEKYNQEDLSIFCNTHFNHEKECTNEARQAVLKLLKTGISVGNQCVILKGINDTGPDMLALHKKLLWMRVRAYYMYDAEQIPGSSAFRSALGKGLEILQYMRGKISGMGIPHFVNDLPGGGGKITLTPDWYLGYDKLQRTHHFRSAVTGRIHQSIEPENSGYEDSYMEYNNND